MKPKYMVNIISPTCFQIACLSGGVNCLDTHDSGYVINIFGITPEKFISTLEEIQTWIEEDHYNHLTSKTWEIKAGQFTDNLTISHHSGGILSIVRGQIKVIFHGYKGLIFGCIPQLMLESKLKGR